MLDGTSNAWEQSRDVAIDELGNFYVVGGTTSPDFPATVGQTALSTGGSELGAQPATDAFVTKLDSFGHIIWSRYLGGPNYDRAYAVEVDANHNVYVAGRAGNGFPTTSGALQENFAGDSSPNHEYGKQDGFVAKISPDGSTIIWATYFGDSGPGIIRDMDIDPSGVVHVAALGAQAEMNAYVTSNAAQKTKHGFSDTFYARISADGSSVLYGSWLGGYDTGSYYSANPAVRALPDGTAYVVTIEPASGAPITSGARAYSGGDDFLVAKFLPSGQLGFCTYVGGSDDEIMDTHLIALPPSGDVVIAGGSKSSDFPVTDSSTLSAPGNLDMSVTVLSSSGQILHSTLIGGSDSFDYAEGISTDSQGNIYLSGTSNSDNLPVTQHALMPLHSNAREGLMAVYSADLSQLKYLSYDGLPGEYSDRSSFIDSKGRWHIVGSVWHMNPYPSTLGLDGNINGLHAAFYEVLDVAPSSQPTLPAKFAAGSAALKVAVIGASTAACKNLVEGGYNTSDCWVNRLQTYLNSIRPGSSVVNLAVSGTGSCHGLPTGASVPSACPSVDAHPIPMTSNNITAALATNPDLVIVNYPHDYGLGVDETIAMFRTIQSAATADGVPIWFASSQPAYNDTASVDTRVDLRNEVQSNFGDRAIDFWNPLVDPQGDGTMSATYVNHYDDKHPNDEGHRLLFEAVKNKIGF